MAIKKHEDIRLNVKPMFLTLYHEYVFEGPCRFGEGMQLEKEFDLHMAAEKFKGWYAQLQAAMPEDVVNLLEPVKVERDEQFLTKDEMIETLAEGCEDVDLYYIGYASRPYDLALEFAMRTGKPCAITQACCAAAITSAEFLSRGLEFYSFDCFTAPCPDLCATRRLNEKQFTMCLNHSLNNEQGVPSACEYDLGAVVSKLMLQAIGRRPSYMGNCFTSPIRNGVRAPLPKALFFTPDHVDEKTVELADAENVVLTFHSVPNRRWESFDEDFRPYAIREFARSGFGATFRYKFEEDAGQVITMCRIDPTCEKLFVAKGTILTSMGYTQTNCSMGVFFQVKDSKDFFQKQAAIGNHMPLIYGDFEEQVIQLGELLGLEIVRA